MKIIFVSSSINIFLFISGYIFLNFFNRTDRNIRNLVAAYPIGIGIWSLIWIISGIILNFTGFKGNLNTTKTVISFLVVLNIIILAKLAKKQYQNKYITKYVWFFLTCVMMIMVTVLFLSFKQAIIFGDSYAFITWSYDLKGVLSQGFPAVGLSLSNISAFFIPDYYNYTAHPIISLCLVILIFESIYFGTKTTDNVKIVLNVIISLFFVLILVFTNNFIWHSIYVNFHNLTAFWVLFISVLIIDKSKPSKKETVLILLLLSFLTVVRMEGLILAMGIIIFFMHNGKYDPVIRRAITGKYMLFLFFYLLSLSFILWQNELFSPKKYITLYVFFLLFVYISEKLYLKHTALSKFTGRIFLLSVLLFYFLCFLFNYDHISQSTTSFIANTFNQSFWGITNYSVVLLVVIFSAIRIKTKKLSVHDGLLMYFIFSILTILILSNFRPPYSERWLDTGNRMLFHFLPLMIVWLGIDTKILVYRQKKLDLNS